MQPPQFQAWMNHLPSRLGEKVSDKRKLPWTLLSTGWLFWHTMTLLGTEVPPESGTALAGVPSQEQEISFPLEEMYTEECLAMGELTHPFPEACLNLSRKRIRGNGYSHSTHRGPPPLHYLSHHQWVQPPLPRKRSSPGEKARPRLKWPGTWVALMHNVHSIIAAESETVSAGEVIGSLPACLYINVLSEKVRANFPIAY